MEIKVFNGCIYYWSLQVMINEFFFGGSTKGPVLSKEENKITALTQVNKKS